MHEGVVKLIKEWKVDQKTKGASYEGGKSL